ncbi:carboxypeptidase-like regulatory domain-containing protein [Ascidiimonas sp. W6]|uniref:carboxypeptidase-like regulatory domain-containing protein n=1 Tax=Ascidiimonas meishanensis TaxID=3128903 RepID=UPI0030EBABBB
MKTNQSKNRKRTFISILSFLLLFATGNLIVNAAEFEQQLELTEFKQYAGSITDSNSGDPLVFAVLRVTGTNISSITNTEGEFLLKIPKNQKATQVVISFLGYQDEVIQLSELKEKGNKIQLTPAAIMLGEVNIQIPKDAEALVREVIDKRKDNYFDDALVMTAFYRETIKKRRRNVSLSEAVVNIYKQPYPSSRSDQVSLYKSRKSTDYSKLDTIALKLQGGPFSALYLDVMKYPEYIFTEELLNDYVFSFERSTRVNNQPVYVIKFNQRKDVTEPRYYGKLYINAKTLALMSAVYKLNLENKAEVSRWFVKRKPTNVKVMPTEAAYRVDYREKNGKWYYGYSNLQLGFKVNWKNKLFNSNYTLNSEMAVTDWAVNLEKKTISGKERLRPSVVLADEASGFSDPQFWGEYNVIEPEKSIESAINKIKRKMRKEQRSK